MQLSNKFSIGDKIVIASHNEGKINEFKTLLAAYNLKITNLSDLEFMMLKRRGRTFQENSLIKVKSVPDNYLAISDDSGLCVIVLEESQEYFRQDFKKNVVDGLRQ